MEKYKNTPPKGLMNAIWGGCFDYQDFDKEVLNETVRDRIYNTWQTLHLVMKKHIEADREGFIKMITETESDIERGTE